MCAMVVSVYLIFSVRLFGKIIKSVNFLTPCSKGILLATLCFGSLRRITKAKRVQSVITQRLTKNPKNLSLMDSSD